MNTRNDYAQAVKEEVLDPIIEAQSNAYNALRDLEDHAHFLRFAAVNNIAKDEMKSRLKAAHPAMNKACQAFRKLLQASGFSTKKP